MEIFEKKEISSFILKCRYKDKYYICNRNENFFDNPIKPAKYMLWWEVPVNDSVWLCSNADMKILEEIKKCSNENLKDQKYLNSVKDRYKKTDPDVNEDERICDIVVADRYRVLKQRMRSQKDRLERLACKIHTPETKLKIYRLMMTQYISWLTLPRYKLPSFAKSGIKNEIVYAFMVVKKNHVFKMVDKGYKPEIQIEHGWRSIQWK